YAALLSMCDAYLGKILDYMDENNMLEDTLLVVNTDQGFLLGENECWAKCIHPFYNEIAKIPLFVWDPRMKIKDQHRDALVQTIDIPATLLEFFDKELPRDMQGKSLKETIISNKKIREAGLFGLHGSQINVTDGDYVYMRDSVASNRPLYEYTHMPTHMRSLFSPGEMETMTIAPPFSFTKNAPVMKIESCLGFGLSDDSPKFGTRLYDLKADPYQQCPISN
ncbi:MAG: sulfatase-like hydrolase/transferase, partial [Oscillospiraceae bacterium]